MLKNNINAFFSFLDIKSEDQYLYNQVAYCVFQYSNLLLSYSGGLDSTVLLDILTNFVQKTHFLVKVQIPPLYLRVVYVHHGLNEEADFWANHCSKQCRIRNIPFHILYIKWDNDNEKKCNIESKARKLRYQALYNYLEKEEVLLTAHHMDDQVETFFLALKRGSSLSGLSGMKKDVLYNDHRLLRPLLECSRMQLEEYAKRKKLIWVNDNTNMDTRFDRNFLRINVLPLLQKRWPSFNKIITRSAQVCRNQENLLKELLLESLNKLMYVDGSLFFYPLLQYSEPKRQIILRYWLNNFYIKVSSYQLLNRIWKEVILSRKDANPILHVNKRYICRRFRNRLYIVPVSMKFPLNSFKLLWGSLNQVFLLPNKLGILVSKSICVNTLYLHKKTRLCIDIDVSNNIFLDYFKTSGKILTNCFVRSPRIDERVFIRFGSVREMIPIFNRYHSRKLKKIWQEYGIPPWLRSRIPLLFYNDTLIAAIGIFITQNGYYQKNNTVLKSKDYIINRIIWLQDSVYLNLFKNFVSN